MTFTEDYEGHAQSKGRFRTNPRCVITLRDDCHLLVLILNLKNFYSTSLLRAEDSEIQTNTLCKHRLLKRTRQKILEKQEQKTTTTTDGTSSYCLCMTGHKISKNAL